MIYSDKYATVDTTYLPARRDDDCCLNCSEGWYEHKGWECKWKHDEEWGFNDLADTERYLTQSMKNSLTYKSIIIAQQVSMSVGDPKDLIGLPTLNPKSGDLSDWRTWAKPKSDTECPCGIHKRECAYHKE